MITLLKNDLSKDIEIVNMTRKKERKEKGTPMVNYWLLTIKNAHCLKLTVYINYPDVSSLVLFHTYDGLGKE